MALAEDTRESLAGLRDDELVLCLANLENHISYLDILLKSVWEELLLLHEPDPTDKTSGAVALLSAKLGNLHEQLDWWREPPPISDCLRCQPIVPGDSYLTLIEAKQKALRTLQATRSAIQHALGKAPEIEGDEFNGNDYKDLIEALTQAVMTFEYGVEACTELFPALTSEQVRERFKRTFKG